MTRRILPVWDCEVSRIGEDSRFVTIELSVNDTKNTSSLGL